MNLSVEAQAFERLRLDADTALNELVRMMEEKNSSAGVLTIKIAIGLQHTPKMGQDGEYIKDDAGNPVMFSIPQFEHKLTSKIQIDGCGKYEGRSDGQYEMYFDPDAGVHVIRDATNQTALF